MSRNRIWLITGASSGFGREIARAALAAGDTVVVTARRPGVLADLADAHPDRVLALPLDVTDQAQVKTAVADAIARFGRIDVLVNNAGRAHLGAVEETSDTELRDLMDLHFFGPAALTREVLPHMRAAQSGAIVQLTSMGGQLAFAGVGGYCAGKFALEGLTEALAQEVAPHGIKVMIVEPGAFRTNLNGAGGSVSEPLAAYDDSVGKLRVDFAAADGTQPGDPAKAADAILTALDADRTPLRLVLGNDAIDAVLAHSEQVTADVRTWEDLGRSLDFA
ncbi:MAG: SDR family NAD(P)-dependent oxidoreductase [Streptomycetaceae bacterium]|nr:SDR family NAD(P)-dependent oxidoreductase [Streptomycetaceae bacterium]